MIRVKTESNLTEVFDYLHKGLYRIALPLAEEAYLKTPENVDAIISFAWALLETGNPFKAQELLTKSRSLNENSLQSRLYRGFLELRLSNYEAGLFDLNLTEGFQKELLSLTYFNKAKGHFALGNFDDAETYFDLACLMAKKSHPEWLKLRKFFEAGNLVKKLSKDQDLSQVIRLVTEADEQEQFWFTNFITEKINQLRPIEEFGWELMVINLKSMLKMNQLNYLQSRLNSLPDTVSDLPELSDIKSALNKQIRYHSDLRTTRSSGIENNLKIYSHDFYKVKSVKLKDASLREANTNEFTLRVFNLNKITRLRLEIELQIEQSAAGDQAQAGFIAWYNNETLLYQKSVPVKRTIESDSVVISDYCDTSEDSLWEYGDASVEFFIDRKKLFEYHFSAENEDVYTDFEGFSDSDNLNSEKTNNSASDILNELNKLTGLNEVKNSIRKLSDYLIFLKERQQIGLRTKSSVSVNAVFLGNPGTGKTTVARLMGKIYKNLGLLPGGEVIEADRSTIVGQYVGETAKIMDALIEKSLGNILFIDEAYTLIKKDTANDFGQEAIDILLKRMEDKRGEFYVIVAGYPDKMQDFLESNPGLRSRFTHVFNFEDYKPDELYQIFTDYANEEEYKISPQAEKILLREFINLFRERNAGFGNARTVRKIFEEVKIELGRVYAETPVHLRDKNSLSSIDPVHLERIFIRNNDKEKYLPEPDNGRIEKIEKAINSLTGMKSFKKEVSDIIKLVQFYHNTGSNPADKFSPHILFLGNPGTGKTTAARLLGELFAALGILEGGQLIEAGREDLVASFVGQTAEKTNKLIDKALGGTLFIDEAYTLKNTSGSDFGQEAIDTLLRRMENERGKFIVIAAGYTEEMQTFLASNSGLAARFSLTFNFDDYTPDELSELILSRFSKDQAVLEESAIPVLRSYLNEQYRTRSKGFGNARFAINLYEKIVRAATLRSMNENDPINTSAISMKITSEDINSVIAPAKQMSMYRVTGDPQKLSSLIKELNSLTGLTTVKSEIESLINSLKISKLRSERGLNSIRKPLHSIFTGNPGTGKTTVARLISKIYKELGVLSKGHLIEVDRAGLVAGYSGQTALKTEQVLNEAKGGTLFIDEAYTLSRGDSGFGQEAIDTILKKMEDLKDDLIVIAAGYTDEMEIFLESNPGLSSRFQNKIIFEDYNPNQLFEIAMEIFRKNGYKTDTAAEQALINLLTRLYNSKDKNFGNARTVRNIVFEIIGRQENRLSKIINPSDEELVTISETDFNLY